MGGILTFLLWFPSFVLHLYLLYKIDSWQFYNPWKLLPLSATYGTEVVETHATQK